VVEIYYNNAGVPEKIVEVNGASAIGAAIAGLMKPHPPRGWSHHTTHDHIINVDGDQADIDAQFIVFNTSATYVPTAVGLPAPQVPKAPSPRSNRATTALDFIGSTGRGRSSITKSSTTC
jgi:hypothetical protein